MARDGGQIVYEALRKVRGENGHPDRLRAWPRDGGQVADVDDVEVLLAEVADVLLDEFQDRLNARLESVRL